MQLRLNEPTPPFPFDPNRTRLWTVSVDGALAPCEMRFVPIGIEIRIFCNESLLMARTFSTPQEALAWPEAERDRVVAAGPLARPERAVVRDAGH